MRCVRMMSGSVSSECLWTTRLQREAAADYCKLREMRATRGANWKHNRILAVHTSSSTSTRTYWRVNGWLSRWRTVVIRASLMRLSWQSSTLFRIVLRPPRLATTSGFFSAATRVTWVEMIFGYCWQKIKWNIDALPSLFTADGC